MKYRLVMFDFDGTLGDTLPWFMTVMDQVADKYEVKRLADHEIHTLRSYSAHQAIKYLGVPAWKLPFIARHVHGLLANDITKVSLFPGVDTLLQHLAANGHILAVVSSNSYGNVTQILGPANTALMQHFECGVSLFGKQAKLKKILGKSGVAATEAIYIGDETRDLEAARRAHIPFGAVAWGYATLESMQAHAPAEIFASIDDIPAKVA